MKPFSVSVSQDPDREYSRQQPNLPTTILRLQGMLEFQEPRDQHPLVFFCSSQYDVYVFYQIYTWWSTVKPWRKVLIEDL